MEVVQKHIIEYGSTEIEFQLKRSDRKTLGITVYPDTTVQVVAPMDAEIKKIMSKVERKARWIRRQQRYFESFLPATPPREYVSGETHFYLGKQYKLKVIKNLNEDVKLVRGQLLVTCSNEANPNRVKGLLGSWYKTHAEKRFQKGLQDALQAFKPYGVKEQPPLVIQRMAKRWGSCTPKGRVILNPEIIKAPSYCIDYVIVHEFCHLVHHHHGKEFYRLQSKIMPDWERWKDRLERVMI